MFGAVAFGFQDPNTLNFVELDPRYGTYSLNRFTFSWKTKLLTKDREFEMVELNPRDHPNYYPDTMDPEIRAILPPIKGLHTPKNPDEIVIVDNFASETAKTFQIKLSKCKQENLPIG